MDRPLDPDVRRMKIARRAGLSVAIVGVVVAALLGGSSLIRPSISRSSIRTVWVDAGPIEATITASGIVVPEFEQVLSSPVDARVVRVLRSAGAGVEPGDPILELDVSESVLALQRLDQALALKENQQARTRLDLEATLGGLESQVKIKTLELENARSVLLRNRKLSAEGLVSDELLRQSELLASRTELELAQIEDSIRIARRSTETQLAGLVLEMETLGKERSEARRQLDLATTKSDRKGVLTFVVSEPGATIRKGDVLARIADLTAFRVDATVSDVHAVRIAAGMPAQVNVNGTRLAGTVSRVLPTIQNGVMTLTVALEEPSSPLLRSNLRVDVLLIADHKENALRVKKGTFGGADGTPEVFVIRGGKAVRTPVRLGVSDFDRYEVLAGLAEGDEVIVSDTTEFQHLKQVKVR